MSVDAYRVDGEGLARFIVARHFPERTTREDSVILEFVARHGHEFDEWEFSRRIGQGATPNPDHPPAIQQNTVRNTQKRIDMLARSGSRWNIIEVKERVTPASLGQILTYRNLYLEENPDAEDVGMFVIGRYSDPDTIRSLQVHGVTVYIYPPADTGGVSPEAT